MFKDYLGIISDLKIKSKNFKYFDLKKLSKKYPQILKIPYSIRILLENVIRNYDGFTIKSDHTDTIINWNKNQGKKDIPYSPSRVLMQDFTGVPAVVDFVLVLCEKEIFVENIRINKNSVFFIIKNLIMKR